MNAWPKVEKTETDLGCRNRTEANQDADRVYQPRAPCGGVCWLGPPRAERAGPDGRLRAHFRHSEAIGRLSKADIFANSHVADKKCSFHANPVPNSRRYHVDEIYFVLSQECSIAVWVTSGEEQGLGTPLCDAPDREQAAFLWMRRQMVWRHRETGGGYEQRLPAVSSKNATCRP